MAGWAGLDMESASGPLVSLEFTISMIPHFRDIKVCLRTPERGPLRPFEHPQALLGLPITIRSGPCWGEIRILGLGISSQTPVLLNTQGHLAVWGCAGLCPRIGRDPPTGSPYLLLAQSRN